MTHDPTDPGPHVDQPLPRSTEAGLFRFCPDCATPLVRVERRGRVRPRCPSCGFTQWRNPGVGVAGIVTEDDVVRLLGVPAVRLGLEDPAWEPQPTAADRGEFGDDGVVIGRGMIGPGMTGGAMTGGGPIGLGTAGRDLVGRVLLVRRRARRPHGWCLPCGWVEYDEEIRTALRREMREETGLDVHPGELFAVHSNFHDPGRQSVGIWFRCLPVGGVLQAGDDADRICFVRPDSVEVPLAFPTDRLVLAKLASG